MVKKAYQGRFESSCKRVLFMAAVVLSMQISQVAHAYEADSLTRYCLKNQQESQFLELSGLQLDARPYLPTARVEEEGLLQNILNSYLASYLQNKDTFAPYYGQSTATVKARAEMLYRNLCQDRDFKPTCKKAKKKLVTYFQSRLSNGEEERLRVYFPNAFAQNSPKYMENIWIVVQDLRQKYATARRTIDQKIRADLFQEGRLDPRIQSSGDFNQRIQNIFSDPVVTNHVKIYEDAYLRYAQGFPGELLLSKALRSKIEGGYFQIDFSDLISATHDQTKGLRNEFKSLVRANQRLLDHWDPVQLLHNDLRGRERVSDSELNATCHYSLRQLLETSDIYPALITDENFAPVRDFSGGDVEVLRYLASNQFQRALWRLSETGHQLESSGLERWLDQNVLVDGRVHHYTPLGGGVSVTKLAHYPLSVKGVYKPKPWNSSRRDVPIWQKMMDSAVSSYKHEIAAYRVDRLLNLNLVPLTKAVNLIDGQGSLQYFVEGGATGRMLREVNMAKPTQSTWKWTRPSGRVSVPSNVRFFDWLVNNIDRYVDNYLILDDGRYVLIDHGLSFFDYSPRFSRLSRNELHGMIPSSQVYERLRYLDHNPGLIDEALGGLLSQFKLNLLKSRVHYFVNEVDQLIVREGWDTIRMNEHSAY